MIKSILAIMGLICATTLAAQTNINLGGISADPTAPVEISADSLSVDQDSGTAVFDGNVLIGQGELRLSASRVEVVYAEETGQIARLKAYGSVTFVTASEAAEASQADYDLTNGILILTGEVLLTQGASAISAERMQVNLDTGNAELSGRVRTVFQQGGN